MAVWAIADLHLSFGVPNKGMERFGPQWISHPDKIKQNWEKNIQQEDLILLPGDFSWAMTPAEATADFQWLEELPGTKVLIRGNHDYWWGSLKQVKMILPPSCHVIQNDAFNWQNISIAGTRLWDSSEYDFNALIDFQGEIVSQPEQSEENEKIFLRELHRLELSLKALNSKASTRIVMTHYPPISADLQPSRVSALLEKYQVTICVFGHLHNIKPSVSSFGERNGVRYVLAACDAIHFSPIQLI